MSIIDLFAHLVWSAQLSKKGLPKVQVVHCSESGKEGEKASLITQQNTRHTRSLHGQGTTSINIQTIQQDMPMHTATKAPLVENASDSHCYEMQVNLFVNCHLTVPSKHQLPKWMWAQIKSPK